MYICDVGFPSICCEHILLPLVSEEATLAYSWADYRKAGTPIKDREGKKVESERCHEAAIGERCQNLTSKPQTCGNTHINRNG